MEFVGVEARLVVEEDDDDALGDEGLCHWNEGSL
jgi:hypothetical protein